MERGACLVEFQLQLKLPGQTGVGLRPVHAQGALRRFHRLGKPPGLGKGGGKSAKNGRIFPASKCIGFLGQFQRLVAVAQRRFRTSGQEPREIILDSWIGWFDLQRRLVLRNRFVHSSHPQKAEAKIEMDSCDVWTDFQRPLKMGGRFIRFACLQKNIAEL